MTAIGTENLIIGRGTPGNTNAGTISHDNIGWTPLGNRIRVGLNPIANGRNIYVRRDRTSGTDPGRIIPAMPLDINQDICFGDVVGDLLKEIEDKFGGALRQKLISNVKHVGIIETAMLSESALAKDWLTPEEDEAWKDL